MSYDSTVCDNASLPECAGREHPHECGKDAVETRIILMEQDMKEIRETLSFIRETIVKADTTITTVANQVMPTLNDVMASPIMKMFGGKK